MRPDALNPLFAPVATLPGVGPKTAKLFDKALERPHGGDPKAEGEGPQLVAVGAGVLMDEPLVQIAGEIEMGLAGGHVGGGGELGQGHGRSGGLQRPDQPKAHRHGLDAPSLGRAHLIVCGLLHAHRRYSFLATVGRLLCCHDLRAGSSSPAYTLYN